MFFHNIFNSTHNSFGTNLFEIRTEYISFVFFAPFSSSPDSLNADRSDKSNAISPSPVSLYKLVVPLLRCEVADVRDAAVNALGLINHDALK